jgi:hypothetical protein
VQRNNSGASEFSIETPPDVGAIVVFEDHEYQVTHYAPAWDEDSGEGWDYVVLAPTAGSVALPDPETGVLALVSTVFVDMRTGRIDYGH